MADDSPNQYRPYQPDFDGVPQSDRPYPYRPDEAPTDPGTDVADGQSPPDAPLASFGLAKEVGQNDDTLPNGPHDTAEDTARDAEARLMRADTQPLHNRQSAVQRAIRRIVHWLRRQREPGGQ